MASEIFAKEGDIQLEFQSSPDEQLSKRDSVVSEAAERMRSINQSVSGGYPNIERGSNNNMSKLNISESNTKVKRNRIN